MGKAWNWLKGVGEDVVDLGKDVFAPGEDDAENAAKMQEQALEEWRALEGQLPTAQQLTPAASTWEAAVHRLGDSEMGQAAADPTSIEAQLRALQGMQDIYAQGGYTASERAQLEQMQRAQASNERSQRQAIVQNAYARGLGGSGAEMAAALAAQQGAANRGAQQAQDIAISGQQRALQALQGAGQLGGQSRGQSFNEAAARASAVDDFNRNNTQYDRDVTRRNVERTNEDKRNVATARQQEFANRANVKAGMTGQYNQAAQTSFAKGDRDDERRRQSADMVAGWFKN